MAQACAFVGGEPTLPPALGEDPTFDRKLADLGLKSEPLYLLMAGVIAAQKRVPYVLGLARTDLAETLATRELERIADFATERCLDGTFAKHMAAHITMRGGSTIHGLEDCIAEEQNALHCRNAADAPALAKLLRDALPGETAEVVDPIRPDLIGEAAVLSGLGAGSVVQQRAAVRRAYIRAPLGTVAAVVRVAQDYASTDDHPALDWLDDLVRESGSFEALIAIIDQLPERTTSLRALASTYQAVMVKAIRSLPDDVRGAGLEFGVLANWQTGLAFRLVATRQITEAVEAGAEAVGLYRALETLEPNTFRPGLATALVAHAEALNAAARMDEALKAGARRLSFTARWRRLNRTRPAGLGGSARCACGSA